MALRVDLVLVLVVPLDADLEVPLVLVFTTTFSDGTVGSSGYGGRIFRPIEVNGGPFKSPKAYEAFLESSGAVMDAFFTFTSSPAVPFCI